MVSFNSPRVASSSSICRPESKSNHLEKRVLLNTKSKSTSKEFKKSQSSISLVSNKSNTSNLNVSKTKANVLNVKVINTMNDGLNVVYVSYGKDFFMLSHDKCVARYALSVNSRVKRVLFTSPIVVKSRFSVAIPPNETNKNLEGEDLLTDSHDSNLYTISIFDMAASSHVCLMSKATSTNHGYGKSKKVTLKPKLVPSTNSKLEMIHMDLCGPMRVKSINLKKYILNNDANAYAPETEETLRLAEESRSRLFMIIADVDNRPPMLEKSLYDSWKSRMELYIENQENGRMILKSVQNRPLVWPTIVEEDGTTRTKRYEELSVAEKL
ncbi:hypothetical protein Tco_1055561 [Tanacetum coccineum]|uniref:Gag-Pol polyprotein n=1 Tax=Tanacetum coccineum TaxID=301880 RepID=A0ABQ5H0B3_9ASTR